MGARSWELVTADESAVIAEPVFNPIVVEDLECDGCFSNSACTDESDGLEVFGETDDRLDYFVASKTSAWWRRRQFTKRSPM